MPIALLQIYCACECATPFLSVCVSVWVRMPVFFYASMCVYECVCVCDFALAVSEPSQLLENDFWHEAAAKTEQLRRQERNRGRWSGGGGHKP